MMTYGRAHSPTAHLKVGCRFLVAHISNALRPRLSGWCALADIYGAKRSGLGWAGLINKGFVEVVSRPYCVECTTGVIHVTGSSGEVDGITRDKLSANPTVGMPPCGREYRQEQVGGIRPRQPRPVSRNLRDSRRARLASRSSTLHASVDNCQSSPTTVCMAWAGLRPSS